MRFSFAVQSIFVLMSGGLFKVGDRVPIFGRRFEKLHILDLAARFHREPGALKTASRSARMDPAVPAHILEHDVSALLADCKLTRIRRNVVGNSEHELTAFVNGDSNEVAQVSIVKLEMNTEIDLVAAVRN